MEPKARVKVGRLLAATRDEALMRQLKEIETRSSFTVEFVSQGTDLVRRAPGLGWSEPPAVLLLDNDLPEVRGRSLLPELVKTRSDLKVIFVAANPTPELEVEIRRSGAYTFMAKPVDSDLLSRIVEKAVDHTSRIVRMAAGFGQARPD
jgi:DNA-binding NtrC family response regulator